MSKFGYSYPAGCSGTPYDEPAGLCDLCGGDVDNDECICHECPVCGEQGNPRCYRDHGLVWSETQQAGADKAEAERKAQDEADAKWAGLEAARMEVD